MFKRSKYAWSVLVAVVALALSASLAFGARQSTSAAWSPPGGGVATLAGDDEPAVEEETPDAGDTEGDEEGVEEGVEDETAGEGGESCADDPGLLTPEELAAARHGSVVCWAAHQTEWGEWFKNKGAFVSCWAHSKKADAPSCSVDPNAEAPATEEPPGDEQSVEEPAEQLSAGRGKGHGKGSGKDNHKHAD